MQNPVVNKNTKTRISGIHTLAISLFILAALYIILNVEAQTNDPTASLYTVDISNEAPVVSSISCCFNNTGGSFPAGACLDGGDGWLPSEGTNYDIVCNFTVTDANGYQDMGDGWVNVTWHRVSVAWNSGLDNDLLYANSSCRNITGTESGNTIKYACLFKNVRYWADAGNWSLLVNLSDGSIVGSPGRDYFTIDNLTTLWQTSSLNFGSMALNANGSQWQPGVVSVNATTNNTGNTVIDLEVEATAANMVCSIGSIPCGNIEYDPTYQKPIDGNPPAGACGQLTAGQIWDADCSELNLGDCTDNCPNLDKTKLTYWGITIPGAGVGGSCSLSITVYAAQGTATG